MSKGHPLVSGAKIAGAELGAILGFPSPKAPPPPWSVVTGWWLLDYGDDRVQPRAIRNGVNSFFCIHA